MMARRKARNTRLPRVKGYVRLWGRYVSARFLLTVLAAVPVFCALYTPVHPMVMRFWYARQTLPAFTLDSPYLAGYTGEARLLLPDGSLLYEGTVLGASAEGTGQLYHGGRLLYEGAFVENRYHGQGRLYAGDGRLLYHGSFANNVFQGEGVLYGEDGRVVYEGYFKDGLFEGQGKWRDGPLRYEGGFLAGLFDGNGKIYQNGALVYAGEFAEGLYNGSGTEYDPASGHKRFEGRYLAGERMEAGTVYAENGEPPAEPFIEEPVDIPVFFNPETLLGAGYDEVCTVLYENGVTVRAVSPPEDHFLLMDDVNGVMYALSINDATGEPLALTHVYLCGMSASRQVAVGMDTRQVKWPVIASREPGTVSEPEAAFGLALSNRHNGRLIALHEIGSVTLEAEERTLTVYFLPDPPPVPVVETDTAIVYPPDESTPQADPAPAPTPAPTPNPTPDPEPPGGIILFLKVE